MRSKECACIEVRRVHVVVIEVLLYVVVIEVLLHVVLIEVEFLEYESNE